MTTFKWNSRFVTNLATVDEQHHRLVDLINALGEHLGGDEVDEAQLETLFRSLAEYADYHFSEG